MNRPAPLARLGLGSLVALAMLAAACVWIAATERWAQSAANGSPKPLLINEARIVNFHPKPLSSYMQILTRPLFRKSRRRWRPTPSARALPAQTPQLSDDQLDVDISLAGIAISGPVKRVFLTTKTQPAGAWLSEGDKTDGWTVTYIHASSVTLKSAAKTVRLTLYPRGLRAASRP